MSARDAEQALALVLANTKMAERPGVRRPHSLPEIAVAIRTAEVGFEGLGKVASRIGISIEMLRRFLSVEHLHPEVQPLVSSRRIDSLNSVLYMSALPLDDQPIVAEALLSGRLSGTDVRALAPLRKRLRTTDVRKLIERVVGSRNRTVYAVAFPLPDAVDLRSISDQLERASGEGLIETRPMGNQRYKAVFTRRGLSNLRTAARNRKLSFRAYMKRLITPDARGTKE